MGLGSGVCVLWYRSDVGNGTLAAIKVPQVRQSSDSGTDTYR